MFKKLPTNYLASYYLATKGKVKSVLTCIQIFEKICNRIFPQELFMYIINGYFILSNSTKIKLVEIVSAFRLALNLLKKCLVKKKLWGHDPVICTLRYLISEQDVLSELQLDLFSNLYCYSEKVGIFHLLHENLQAWGEIVQNCKVSMLF